MRTVTRMTVMFLCLEVESWNRRWAELSHGAEMEAKAVVKVLMMQAVIIVKVIRMKVKVIRVKVNVLRRKIPPNITSTVLMI